VSQPPQPGDRFRLFTRDHEPDHHPGDRGTVHSGPHPVPSGGAYYAVEMDGHDGCILLRDDEMEPDV
jgi:hypothetical protein